MAVEMETVQRRVQDILTFVKELKGLSDISLKEFKKNRERQYAVMHILQLAIEATLSLANHIIARERLGIPKNYQDSFTLLERGGVLPEDFADEMKKMARFRNRLVHIYWDVDLEQLHEIITTKAADFEKFVKLIKKKYPA